MSGLLGRTVALALLIGLAPIMALLWLLVWHSNGRPVLFRQMRSGRNGVPFELVKFRTMNENRDANGALLPDEQRVSRLGKALRKSRLDELPGLWNVVRGDLAFIGPRPLLPHTIAALGEAGVRRGAVAPGLTGWAQVNGNTLLTLDEKIALDLWYIDHRGPVTDLAVLMRTLWVMTAGEKRRHRSLPSGSGLTG